MEQTLAEIWESSRHNQYYWLLPAVLSLGAVFIVASSWIRKPLARRLCKLGLFLVFSFAALSASSMQINEKWHLRHKWAKARWETLSDEERQAVTADGGNMLLGPVVYGGGYSVIVFGLSLAASSIITRKNRVENQKPELADN